MECCRLCPVKEELLDVFDARFQNGGDVVRLYIYLSSGVEILATDIVSKKICQQCMDQILYMFQFRTKAGLHDRKLKKDAGMEVEKEKPVLAMIKNNLIMIKKIANSLIKSHGVSDVIVIDDEMLNESIAAPMQLNNVVNDQLATTTTTTTTTDNEMVTEETTAEKDVAKSNEESVAASTSLQNNTEMEKTDVNGQSKDGVLTLQSSDEIGEPQVNDSLLNNKEKESELNDEVSCAQLVTSNSEDNNVTKNTDRNGSSPKRNDNSVSNDKTANDSSLLTNQRNEIEPEDEVSRTQLDSSNSDGIIVNSIKSSLNQNDSSIYDKTNNDSSLLIIKSKEIEPEGEVSRTQLDTTDSNENKTKNGTKRKATSLKHNDNSSPANVKTKREAGKSRKRDNSSSKRKSNNAKQLNISVIEENKSQSTDKSSNNIDTSISEKRKVIEDSDANNSQKDDAITPNPKKTPISNGRNKNGSKQMDVSVRRGKKANAISKDSKGQQQTPTNSSRCENETIDSSEKTMENSTNKKCEALQTLVQSESINNVLKEYPKLIISPDILDLNVSPTLSLRRCDEVQTHENSRKRALSPVAVTRTRKRLRGSLPIQPSYKRLEANTQINNMEEKKEMFVSSLELVSKDKIQDPAPEDTDKLKLHSCLDCSDTFKSRNSLRIHRRRQCCKWCTECIKCTTNKHKHENECKFKKKLVVNIEKLNDEAMPAPETGESPQNGVDIDVEIAVKEYILNKMTMTKEKIVQTDMFNMEQPIVQGNKIRYRNLYKDIASSYMPVHLCLSTKNKSKIVRTYHKPTVKYPITEVKNTTYEKKTDQQINDILQRNNDSTVKSPVGVVAKQQVVNVPNGQQQMSTESIGTPNESSAGNQQMKKPNIQFATFRASLNPDLMLPINYKKVNVASVHHQLSATMNKQIPVTEPEKNQQKPIIISKKVTKSAGKKLTAVINKQKVNIPVIKPTEGKQLSAVVNQQEAVPVTKCTENKELNAVVTKKAVNVRAAAQQLVKQLPAIRPAPSQPMVMPATNPHFHLSGFRPAVNQQMTVPNINLQMNYRPITSQHITIPLKNLANKQITIPVNSLRHANPGMGSILTIPYSSTVATGHQSATVIPYDNVSKAINTSSMNTLNTNLNANQFLERPTAHTFVPNILNSKMGQSNILKNQLSNKVSKNETATTSSWRTVSTASRVAEAVGSRTPGNIHYVSSSKATSTSGGQCSSTAVAVLQMEKVPMNGQVFSVSVPNEQMQTASTNSEKSTDGPVILNGSRTLNKIWVKNPMEINNSANI